jgi:hypothetical protein
MEEANGNITSNYSISTASISINNITNLSTKLPTDHFYNETVETNTQSNLDNISRQSWNLTRVEDSFSKVTTSASGSLCTTIVSTTTEEPFDEFGPPEGVEYIFVPLGVMIFVIVLSAVVRSSNIF